MSFQRFRDTYEDEVARTIGFAGQDHAFFIKAKVKELLRMVDAHVGPPKKLSILDVGCGIGLAADFLQESAGSLHGTDVSAELIERARNRHRSVVFTLSQDGSLPFHDGSFDVAFAFCVLHHVGDSAQPQLVAEMARVVRPGGLVAVAEHNPLNPLTRLVVHRCEFDVGVQLLGPKQVCSLLEDAGLRVVERPYILFFPWRGTLFRRLERKLRRVPLGAQHVVAARR